MIVTANVEGLEYMKKVWWSKALNVVVMVLVPLMAVRIFFYFIFGLLVNIETGEEIEFTVVEFLFFCFLVWYTIYLALTPQRMLKKLNKISRNVVETVNFGENGFTAYNRGETMNEQVDYAYDRVTKATFSKNWFVISCDKNRVYPIHVRSFVQGTPDELRALLRAKLGDKFKEK